MKSFKLSKGETAKQQAISAGAILLVLGILTYAFLYPTAGFFMGVVGVALVIIGLAAKR